MKKNMDHMKGKVDQILKTITTMGKEEGVQQDAAVRNIIFVFPSVSQPALINLVYGVPPRYYP